MNTGSDRSWIGNRVNGLKATLIVALSVSIFLSPTSSYGARCDHFYSEKFERIVTRERAQGAEGLVSVLMRERVRGSQIGFVPRMFINLRERLKRNKEIEACKQGGCTEREIYEAVANEVAYAAGKAGKWVYWSGGPIFMVGLGSTAWLLETVVGGAAPFIFGTFVSVLVHEVTRVYLTKQVASFGKFLQRNKASGTAIDHFYDLNRYWDELYANMNPANLEVVWRHDGIVRHMRMGFQNASQHLARARVLETELANYERNRSGWEGQIDDVFIAQRREDIRLLRDQAARHIAESLFTLRSYYWEVDVPNVLMQGYMAFGLFRTPELKREVERLLFEVVDPLASSESQLDNPRAAKVGKALRKFYNKMLEITFDVEYSPANPIVPIESYGETNGWVNIHYDQGN